MERGREVVVVAVEVESPGPGYHLQALVQIKSPASAKYSGHSIGWRLAVVGAEEESRTDERLEIGEETA